jgi:hypothetical protein
MTASERSVCPSSTCRPGSVLFGIVLPGGRIAYAANRVVVDEEFVRAAHEGRPPEQRFRFSSGCIGQSCRQWEGRQCGLIDRLLLEYERDFGPTMRSRPLPDCPIRPECRWFLQRGGRACEVCSVLVTDLGRPENELPDEVIARRALYRLPMPGAAPATPKGGPGNFVESTRTSGRRIPR